MGYQRSRQTPTVATLEITTSCHENSRTSSSKRRAAHDKENVAVSMPNGNVSQRRNPSRSKNVVNNQPVLEENGGSQSMCRKAPSRGKRAKCQSSILGEENVIGKRTCVQIRTSNDNLVEEKFDGLPESHSVPVDGESVLANELAVNCDSQDSGRCNDDLCVEEVQGSDKENRALPSRHDAITDAVVIPLNNGNDARDVEFSDGEPISTDGPDEDQSAATVISKGTHTRKRRYVGQASGRCNDDLCVEEVQGSEKENCALPSRHDAIADAVVIPLNNGNDARAVEFSDGEPISTDGPVEDQSAASVISKAQEIYSKLHEKYKRLKKRKLGLVEEYIEEQNKNLIAYTQAYQELLDHFRRENDRLKLHGDQEKITVTLNRLSLLEQEKIECQNNLLVLHTKNLELSNEVKRLQSLLSDHVDVSKKIQNISVLCQSCKVHCFTTEGQFSLSQDIPSEKNGGCGLVPYTVGLASKSTLKNLSMQTEVFESMCQACGHNNSADIENQERRLVGNETSQAPDKSVQTYKENGMKVGSIKSIIYGDSQLGNHAQKGEAADMVAGRVNSLVTALLQCMVGFKITIADERKSPKLIFLHQSSGYSFQLMCLHYENNLSEDGELVYQLVSLGTLHKIAPEWMKQEIIFSMAQIDVFFDRILQVANGHGFQRR